MAFKSFASFNRNRLFNIDTADFEYLKLKDLYERDGDGATYVIRGLYLGTKSDFAEETPIVATDDCYVNIPQHQLIDIKEMLNDKQAINMINAGAAGFMIDKYTKKLKNGTKTCYKAVWVDLDADATVD